MAMGTERSKPLHNFTLPCDLRWGNQRFLRCMKVNSGGKISPRHANSSDSSDHHHHIQQRRSARDRERERQRDKDFTNGSAAWGGGRRFVAEDDKDGIAATREKVMLDLQTAADKMKSAFFKDGGLEEGEVSVSRPLPLPPPPPPPPPHAASSAEAEAQRPWNLRTRRAACRTPAIGFVAGSNGGGAKGPRVDAPRPNPGSFQMRAPAVAAVAAQKSPSHPTASGDKMERAKFSVSLSKRDIEEDFFAIAGHRPPRRPKKRARIVQKQLDTLFPGLWLTEVTPDMYKVPEAAP